MCPWMICGKPSADPRELYIYVSTLSSASPVRLTSLHDEAFTFPRVAPVQGKKCVQLPTVTAIQDQLDFTINFSQKLGRHAVATRDLAAGELPHTLNPKSYTNPNLAPAPYAQTHHAWQLHINPASVMRHSTGHAFCPSQPPTSQDSTDCLISTRRWRVHHTRKGQK